MLATTIGWVMYRTVPCEKKRCKVILLDDTSGRVVRTYIVVPFPPPLPPEFDMATLPTHAPPARCRSRWRSRRRGTRTPAPPPPPPRWREGGTSKCRASVWQTRRDRQSGHGNGLFFFNETSHVCFNISLHVLMAQVCVCVNYVLETRRDIWSLFVGET